MGLENSRSISSPDPPLRKLSCKRDIGQDHRWRRIAAQRRVWLFSELFFSHRPVVDW